MYEIDYDIIMDKVSDKYHISILDAHRKMLVLLYQVAVSATNSADTKTFEDFCEITMLHSYLEKKYPRMDLYDRAYSPWAKN